MTTPPRPADTSASPSPHEGRVMTASGGRRFLVRDGRRYWIDNPPPDCSP